MIRRRGLAALLLLPLLAACNMVSGPRQDFGKGAAADQLLKPGFWTTRCFNPAARPSDCRLHEHRFIVSGRSVAPFPAVNLPDESDMNNPKPGPDIALDYAIVQGEPILMEWAGPVDPAHPDDAFFYTTIEPMARDAEGRIARLKLWPVLCGPPRNGGNMALNNTGNDEQWVSDRPLPGLKMDGKFCTAGNEAAIRNAARKARSEDAIEAYWMADKPQ